MDRDPFDLVGDVLDGQFRVLEVVGEGDLSIVYKGHHMGVDAPVAIKCLNLPSTLDAALVEPLVESFRQVARLHYRLAEGNLHIARTLTSGSTLAPRTGAQVPYVVREWLDGESLKRDLGKRRKEGKQGRSVDDAVRFLEPALEGVAHAHRLGVVHLSLHPSNLFLAKRGEQATLKVLDFGVARTMNELAAGLPRGSSPSHGLRVLLPEYAAPEQLDRSVGSLGPPTDVYALALVMMEVLSDRAVIAGQETGALVAKVLDKKNRPTPRAHGLHLPKDLEAALARAVALDPKERQKDAATFWNEVKASRKPPARATTPFAEKPNGAPAPSPVLPAPVPQRQPQPAFEPQPGASPPVPAPTPLFAAPPVAPFAAFPAPPPQVPAPMLEIPIATPSTASAFTVAPARIATSSRAGRPFPAWPALSALPRLPVWMDPWVASFSRLPRSILAAVVIVWALALTLGVAIILVTVTGAERRASAAVSHGVTPLAPAPSSSTSAENPAVLTPLPEPLPAFSARRARRALDGVSRDIMHCRRTKLWGTAYATISFANDGSVSNVAIGPPFRGTQAAECVSDIMSAVHIPAFGGKPGAIEYQFFVKDGSPP